VGEWRRALVYAFVSGVGGAALLDLFGLDGPTEAKVVLSMGMGLLGAALALTRGG